MLEQDLHYPLQPAEQEDPQGGEVHLYQEELQYCHLWFYGSVLQESGVILLLLFGPSSDKQTNICSRENPKLA